MKEYEEILTTNGVTFYQPIENIDETKRAMKRFYDKCNEVFKDRPELFIEEKVLKKDAKNIFIWKSPFLQKRTMKNKFQAHYTTTSEESQKCI